MTLVNQGGSLLLQNGALATGQACCCGGGGCCCVNNTPNPEITTRAECEACVSTFYCTETMWLDDWEQPCPEGWSGGYGIEAVVGVNCNKLVNLYSAEVATQEAMMLGYSVMGEKILPDGTVELLIQA